MGMVRRSHGALRATRSRKHPGGYDLVAVTRFDVINAAYARPLVVDYWPTVAHLDLVAVSRSSKSHTTLEDRFFYGPNPP